MTLRVLIAVHAHPRFSAGGGETAAYSIHRQLQQLDGVESRLLATADDRWLAYGTDLGSLAPDEWLIRRSSCGFFYPSSVDLAANADLAQAVIGFAPDVIHVHHYMHLGIDLIHALKQWCPAARLVLTLHEFLAMCAHHGQLLQRDGRLCDGPNAIDCQRCLPERSAMDLVIREQLMARTLERFDSLVAPSHHLADHYERWAQSRQINIRRPVVIENLLPPSLIQAQQSQRDQCPRSGSSETAMVFGYFGQLHPNKGIDHLLDAWERVVAEQPRAQLIVHGPLPNGGREIDDYSAGLRARFQCFRSSLIFAGRYGQDELPQLMDAVDWVVMSSLWGENSPVVIQEARLLNRPMLVPGFGGMAEKIRDGIDGLHYIPRSPFALSQTILHCCGNRALLRQLRISMAPPPQQDDVLAALLAEYRGEPSPPVDPFPSSGRMARSSDATARLQWSDLQPHTEFSMMHAPAHAEQPAIVRVECLPAGNWRLAGTLPVAASGIWQLNLAWNGVQLAQLLWEVEDAPAGVDPLVIPWGWSVPHHHPDGTDPPGILRPSVLELQAVRHAESTSESKSEVVGRIIWLDPAIAVDGMGALQWIQSINRLASLVSCCQSHGAVAELNLHGPEPILEPLRRLWPYLRGAPAWSSGANVSLQFGQTGWTPRPSFDAVD